MDIGGLRADLAAEHEALDSVVAELSDDQWQLPTPADGWAVRDCIGHLCYFDESARLALTDPAAFKEHVEALMSGAVPVGDTELARSTTRQELLERWRGSRAELLDAIAAADSTERVPWYGPPMSLASFVTARMMETWAHGQDVVDAVEAEPVVSERLRHVVDIGIRARPYSLQVNGLEDSGTPIKVEARAPGGDTWTWGPDDATDWVTGSALDLALVFTQRRHRDDTGVTVTGDAAEQWMAVAQAFAGPAGTGRKPGMRRFAE